MAGEASGTAIEALDGVVRLVREVVDPNRGKPIVCISIPTWASGPLLDPVALAAELGELADIYVLPTGELSWELTDRLPPRLDVYGGAVRIWWPLEGREANPFEHPLFLIHDRSESDQVITRIVESLERRGFLKRERLAEGAEVPGVVTRVLRHGAELRVAGGEEAFAHTSHLTSIPSLGPAQVVRAGQAVRVRVGSASSDGRRVPVSLLPFEPDLWERFQAQYHEGMLVEGVVGEMRNFGAFVEIFPGIRGVLHKGQITREEWVSHPEDQLIEGEVIAVRITRIDRDGKQIDLSCLGVDKDEETEVPAALYPDGPPWLEEPPPEPDEGPADEEIPEEPALEAVADPETITEEAATDDSAGEGVFEPLSEPAEAEVEEAVEQAPTEAVAEAETLESAIAEGRELQAQLAGAFGGTEQRLRELRAEASQVRQLLERDLSEARLRLLELAEGQTKELIGSTEAALASARGEAADYRERLAAAEDDRRQLLQRLKEERESRKETERHNARLRKELRSERAELDRLERRMATGGLDEGERFVREVRDEWERRTSPSDRAHYPWREPALGPEFLESLASVQGVRREKVAEVCAHVVSGRAAEIAGLELHPLRTSEAGDAPQRERADRAKAWRCSIQTGTPSARRLHYWRLPDGSVEIAKVVYHDDLSIR
jgi:predicted RNA-binding protein with RPS1 domain